MVIDSISCGLIVENWSFANGTPSTTINGDMLWFTEPAPLIFMEKRPSRLPPVWATCTPLALPCNASAKLVTGRLWISFSEMVVTAPVRSFFLAVPYPITTTSFIFEKSSVNCTTIFVLPFNSTSWVTNPTDDTTKTASVLATERLNSPFALVVVPF